MKVYDRNLTGASAAGTTRLSETQESGRSSSASIEGAKGDGDRVELSSTMGRLSSALSSYQSDRAAAVEALAARYQAGQYQPDWNATGRAIVSETLAAAAQ